MANLNSKNTTVTLTSEVFSDVVAVGGTSYPRSHIEITDAVRVESANTPFMLHTVVSGVGNDCLAVSVVRVVEQPKGCGFSEFKYAMPCVCTSSRLLPAGIYDITIEKQIVSDVQVGDKMDVTFVFEPVSDSFANIYSNMV